MTDTTTVTEPAKKRRFGCFSIILLLLTIVLFSAAIAIWMAKSDPAELKQVNADMAAINPAEQLARADNLEARFTSAMQGIDSKTGMPVKPTADGNEIYEQELTISVIDANLWMTNKLGTWLTNRKASLPKALADPRVWIEDGQLVLSMRVSLAAVQGVVSFALETVMQPDGQMLIKVAKIRTGKLRVPTGIVADQVQDEFKKAQAGIVKTLGDAFDGSTIDPVFPDSGGDPNRMTRLLEFKIHPDHVKLKFRSGPKDVIQGKKK